MSKCFPILAAFLAYLPFYFLIDLLWFFFTSLFSPFPYQVSADFIKSGEFTLERMGVPYKAKAHLKTPFDPENKRVKGIYDWDGPQM